MIRNFMGYDDFTSIDTGKATNDNNPVLDALNAGLRQVSNDLPFTVKDSIKILADTWMYTLNTNFKPDGHEKLKDRGFTARHRSKNQAQVVGLRWVEAPDIITVAYAPGVPYGFNVKGTSFWLFYPSPQGDTIFVEGPGDPTPVSHGGSALSPVPKKDREAAVYWAIAILADARRDLNLAASYREKYNHHLREARGALPVSGGP